MKTNVFKVLRSGICLLLALCMVVGMCPVVAFAEETSAETGNPVDVNGDGQINYVSLGDSMTNGYCLPGYYVGNDDGDADNALGYRVVAPNTYTDLFAKHLAQTTGLNVHHDQLAISGMRIEELHFLLDEEYEGDIFTWLWFDARNNGILAESSPYYFKDAYHDAYVSGQIDNRIDKAGDLHQDVDGTCRFARILMDENNKNINVYYDIFEDNDWGLWTNRFPSAFKVFAEKAAYDYDVSEMNAFFANTDPATIKAISEAENAPLYAQNANEWVRWDYQNSIKNADVITMSFGSNNFGHFVKTNINVLLNIGAEAYDVERCGYYLDPILEETGMADLYNAFMAEAKGLMLASMGVDAESLPAESSAMLDDVLDIMGYAFITYVNSFTGSINKIHEMNPEAQVVICGMINDMAGIELSLPGFVDAQGNSIVMPGGDVYALLVDSINAYMAAYDAQYIKTGTVELPAVDSYPEAIIADMPDTVEMVIDQYAQLDPHGRIYQDGYQADGEHSDPIRHYDCPDHMADWLLTYYLLHKLEDGVDHGVFVRDNRGVFAATAATQEELVSNMTYNLLSVLLNCDGGPYDSKEAALYALRAMWINGNNTHTHLDGTVNYHYDSWGAQYQKCLYINYNGEQVCFTEMYLELIRGVRNAVIEGAKHTNHNFDSINKSVDTVVGKCLVENLGGIVKAYYAKAENERTQFEFADAVTAALVADEEASSYMYWYARMLAGNGSGVHPTLGGHRDMYDCLEKAWDEGFNSRDYINVQASEKMVVFYDFLKNDDTLNT